MFPEVVQLIHVLALAEGPPSAPASDSSPQVTVALIGLAGLVLSAVIAGYFGTRGERADRAARPTAAELQRQLDEAVYDAAVAEDELREALARVDTQRARLDVYERALVVRGFAPWRFITGEERDDDARIPRA